MLQHYEEYSTDSDSMEPDRKKFKNDVDETLKGDAYSAEPCTTASSNDTINDSRKSDVFLEDTIPLILNNKNCFEMAAHKLLEPQLQPPVSNICTK